MKKVIGLVSVLFFISSYAMESEKTTLSIVNKSPKCMVLVVKLKDQKPYRRCLVPEDGDFHVIKKSHDLEKIEVGIVGTEGSKKINFTGKQSCTHSLMTLNISDLGLGILDEIKGSLLCWDIGDLITDGFFRLEKPMSVEYPEFNCLCGHITSRITDTIHYFPGAYRYISTHYSTLGIYGQMETDSIPAVRLLNIPNDCDEGDVEHAYAELCEIWNPQRFKNPHQQRFAQRMMAILTKKYEFLNQ